MKNKINISITVNTMLYDLLKKNFDNNSAVIEWFIIDELTKNINFKKRIDMWHGSKK